MTFQERRKEIEDLFKLAHIKQKALAYEVLKVTPGDFKEKICALKKEVGSVAAIQHYREVYGTSLGESKKCVEAILAEKGCGTS